MNPPIIPHPSAITSCSCGRKSAGRDTLCREHWRELPAALKNAWRIAEREGGESLLLVTARIREYAQLLDSIDRRERDLVALGRDPYRKPPLQAKVRALEARRIQILQRFSIHETLAA